MKSIYPKFTNSKQPAIIILGCSFTDPVFYGYVINKINIWPNLFRDKLFPNCKIINLAKAGRSNDYAFKTLIRLLQNNTVKNEYDIQAVVWQGTEWERTDFLIPWLQHVDTPFMTKPGIHFLSSEDYRKRKLKFPDKKSSRIEFDPIIGPYKDPEQNLLSFYYKENLKGIIDKNIIKLLTILQMCQFHNIKFLFAQVLETIGNFDALNEYLIQKSYVNDKDNQWYNFNPESYQRDLTKYMLYKSNVFPTLLENKKYFPGFPWTNGWGMWRPYRSDEKYVLGEDAGNERNPYNWHPNQKGHQVIADYVIKHWRKTHGNS